MVCHTQPCGKSSMGSVWKRAGTFKEKVLAGDWMNHLANFNQSDQRTIRRSRRAEAENISSFKKRCCSLLFFQLIKLWYNWCYSSIYTLVATNEQLLLYSLMSHRRIQLHWKWPDSLSLPAIITWAFKRITFCFWRPAEHKDPVFLSGPINFSWHRVYAFLFKFTFDHTTENGVKCYMLNLMITQMIPGPFRM